MDDAVVYTYINYRYVTNDLFILKRHVDEKACINTAQSPTHRKSIPMQLLQSSRETSV